MPKRIAYINQYLKIKELELPLNNVLYIDEPNFIVGYYSEVNTNLVTNSNYINSLTISELVYNQNDTLEKDIILKNLHPGSRTVSL